MTGVFVCNAQQAAKQDTSKVSVEVSGAKPITISAAEFAKYPRKEVRGKDHDGKESVYSGVELREILKPLGVTFGTALRGKQLSQYILIEAADGYRAVLAIAELDPEFTDDVVILADTQDGKPLSEKDGKFQIIVPADKRHGRWVRQTIAIRVRSGN
jgi:DMSO/TMAO reductase YedYZ molybdopterin-dependent catalytic subunit